MDIFDGEALFEMLFTFKETEPVGEKWAFFKFENSNFIMNSGSYFVIIVGMVFYGIANFIINKICVHYSNKP